MADTIFWDCGTQLDLADLGGLLYVDGANTIRPKLARLARRARERGIPRLITRVAHREGDPDLAVEKPDFKATFPVHCMEGTPGAGPIPETAPERAVELGREDQGERSIRDALRAYQGEVVLDVAGFDPFAHPAIRIVLEELKPRRVVVFGVPAERWSPPSWPGCSSEASRSPWSRTRSSRSGARRGMRSAKAGPTSRSPS